MVNGVVPSGAHDGYVFLDQLLFLLEFSFDDAVQSRRSTGEVSWRQRPPSVSVRGLETVLDTLKQKLRIDVGETTADHEFTLEVTRCFGACGLAPVITVNDEVHHRVKPNKVEQILSQYRHAAKEA